ncbi:AtpZ/AtpI family protein [Pedobacter panaciterrae]
MNRDPLKDKGYKYVKYSGLGFQMILVIAVFTYAGYKIDELNHHKIQWVTCIFSLIGVLISIYLVITSLSE